MYITFSSIFSETSYHFPHYWYVASDISAASDNPAHYEDAIHYNI
ncbi:sensor dcuS domain protein [Shigella boydii]|nr:sensor dcuS domain protein [Shigella boydii]